MKAKGGLAFVKGLHSFGSVSKYLQQTHKKLWTRSQFGTDSKVDYVTNNLAESFNNWIKEEKTKHIDDLMDTIR